MDCVEELEVGGSTEFIRRLTDIAGTGSSFYGKLDDLGLTCQSELDTFK